VGCYVRTRDQLPPLLTAAVVDQSRHTLDVVRQNLRLALESTVRDPGRRIRALFAFSLWCCAI
jgi:hypothetical protein